MKISILMLSIRPQNLVKCYNAISESCKKHKWEVVIPSPYLIPEELMTKGNVKFIHTYACPTTAMQIGVMNACGEFLYNITDDGLLLPNAIDDNIDLIDDYKTILNMRYNEAVLDPYTLELFDPSHKHFDMDYWRAGHHPDLRLNGINPNWGISMHYFMHTNYFLELGGLDCEYEYTTYPIMDLMFRAQLDGAKMVHSRDTAFYCSHLPHYAGDHQPVHDAQTGPDYQRWIREYHFKTERSVQINFDNWKDHNEVWTRRFSTLKLKP